MEVKPDDASGYQPGAPISRPPPNPKDASIDKVAERVLGAEPLSLTAIPKTSISKVTLAELSPIQRKAYISFLKELPGNWKGKEKFIQGVEKEHGRLEALEKEVFQAKITEKEAEWWDCVDCRANTGGGHVFDYTYKPESRQRSQQDIYPAGEPDETAVINWYLLKNDEKQKPLPESIAKKLGEKEVLTLEQAYAKYGVKLIEASRNTDCEETAIVLFLNDLGIKASRDEQHAYKLVLTLPDCDALQVRWNALREKNPQLPPLTFKNSAGIAGNLEFTYAFLTADSLISEGKEHVHDVVLHVTRLIRAILRNPEKYSKDHFEAVKAVGDRYNRLLALEANTKNVANDWGFTERDFEILETSLGAAVDIHTATETVRATKEGFADSTSSIFRFETSMQVWAKNKLGPDVLSKAPILWNRLEAATSPLFGYTVQIDDMEADHLLRDEPIGTSLIAEHAFYLKSFSFEKFQDTQKVAYKITTSEDGMMHARFTIDDNTYETSGKSHGELMSKMLHAATSHFQAQQVRMQKLLDSYLPKLKAIDFRTGMKELSKLQDKPPGSLVMLQKSRQNNPNAFTLHMRSGKWDINEYTVTPTVRDKTIGFTVICAYPQYDKFFPAETVDDVLVEIKKDLDLNA